MAMKQSKRTAWAIAAAAVLVVAIVAIVLGVTLSNRNDTSKGASSSNSNVGGSSGDSPSTSEPSFGGPVSSPSPSLLLRPTSTPSTLTDEVECKAETKTDAEGPFYTPNAPFINSNDSLAAEGEPGMRIEIEIRLVQNTATTTSASLCGTPLSDWIIDVWHASDAGVYDNTGYNLRGKYKTDADGRILLKTVLPGFYQPRPRHVHFKIWSPQDESVLTSQFYMGDSADELAALKQRYGERVVEVDNEGKGLLELVVN